MIVWPWCNGTASPFLSRSSRVLSSCANSIWPARGQGQRRLETETGLKWGGGICSKFSPRRGTERKGEIRNKACQWRGLYWGWGGTIWPHKIRPFWLPLLFLYYCVFGGVRGMCFVFCFLFLGFFVFVFWVCFCFCFAHFLYVYEPAGPWCLYI